MKPSCFCLTLALMISVMACGQDNRKSTENTVKTYEVTKPDSVWRKQLTPQQYYVLRQKGTERAFTGEYWNSKKKGTYCCAACSNPLFHSDKKFDSGTGWPSFTDIASAGAVDLATDYDLGYARTEVLCGKCGGHLGHVFDDGPLPTRLRYCINSAALKQDSQ
jgi:peptide-methionine (R)-S-oxide reductase